MARVNVKQKSDLYTHEGAPAKVINPELQLRRSILACMLWEDSFYEDGISIADRIKDLVGKVDPEIVSEIAIEAREKAKLRHAPLWIVREMAKLNTHKYLVSETLSRIIQRPDELTEFVALYWKDGKQSLSAQVKKGLARAFNKFDEYQFAKYNRNTQIKLKDVLFLCHAKPENEDKEVIFKKIVDNMLQIPDTWETNLSAGQNKKETWERLLSENKLGALALLRNLRNMISVDVNMSLIKQALINMKTEKVLPFRFIAAANHAQDLEPELETAMFKCLEGSEKLTGRTVLLVDVSGSMKAPISDKTEISRMEPACGLAMLMRELCNEIKVFTFSDELAHTPPRRGFALKDAIITSQSHSGTYLGNAIRTIDSNIEYDRIVIITDEQSHDRVPDTKGRGYLINVASYQNGVGYGKTIHIDGWSESVINWIIEYEKRYNTTNL